MACFARFRTVLVVSFTCLAIGTVFGQQDRIPHAQDKPPGPALSPAEAIKRMTVPEGFSVELVAAEPDLVNPVAMTIDERGRFWVTESLDYPRRDPGPGRDRVKVLEDTDGDGKADKFTIFAEGLNIPSGIAIGYGGVWVANAPDILFMQDTDGDGKADKREVVVTGFGRDDTHELPNSLTWGPDGWLYGLNGVFNSSVVVQNGKEHRFTCALFRIHPRTREFQLFAEGTSNPWGIAWDAEGSAFVSACVIDHLWHLAETGYYHRQGGPYPPYTWKLGSIVQHLHQKAAYCGIHYFDSDAYPESYRGKLYMGNIHGGCINVDALERKGSTYLGTGEPDLLTANDAWFMPVVQKTGPDGSLYVLDWYDRYHCYQDASRDPAGIDRLHGRLYRVRYKDTPRASRFNLAEETDQQLIDRLHSPNVCFRDLAQRLLTERNREDTRLLLKQLVLDHKQPRKARMHALWVLVGSQALDAEFHQELLAHSDPGFRAWGVRAAGNFAQTGADLDDKVRDKCVALASDESADVRLQVAIAARKLHGVDSLALLLDVLSRSGDDPIIPTIVWQNLHPLLEKNTQQFLKLAQSDQVKRSPAFAEIMGRAVERIIDEAKSDPASVAALFSSLVDEKAGDPQAAKKCLALLVQKVQNREIAGADLDALRKTLTPGLQSILASEDSPLLLDGALLAATWKDPSGSAAVRKLLSSPNQPEAKRLEAFKALVAAGDESLLDVVSATLENPKESTTAFRGAVLTALGRLDDAKVARVVLRDYDKLEPELQPAAIELLTQRVEWARALMSAVASKQIPADELNINQVRKLLASRDKELADAVRREWGSVRTDRNPQREQVIAEVRRRLQDVAGDPHRGQEVFKRVCAQCHKMYGEGQEVGPDLTSIGRTSLDLLLSNVLDPSLVIGTVYQATAVSTVDGRVLVGILVEDNDQRVVLKIQGGKLETIARDDIDEMKTSTVSMMPEDLEKQIKPDELIDLFAFLSLDKPPSDPTAKQLPGLKAATQKQGK